MKRDAITYTDIQPMADEVSGLIKARFGGARRGEQPPLAVMLRRRGGALPRKLRNAAARLAEAERLSAQPKVARQLRLDGLDRAHTELVAYLRPLGEISRWRGRAVSFAASVCFGLLVLGAVIVWIMVQRGHI
ncbi:hypothetical protein PAF17_01445 [Paracoccus sp. Z330]|uniref:Uncharacterized protein n=1 Tax=Paracoccus onchidii TaxID=3017813 RepID=A0ABT4Z9Z4_9RHOB|nr:hypothetical protein [Paracoccus onchidii]MDB6176169.1 hypothetical protein [Paracoccus onchidii]